MQPEEKDLSRTYQDQMDYIKVMYKHFDRCQGTIDRVNKADLEGCFVPKTIEHNDRIVKDDRLWSPQPMNVNGSIHLTNNATTFPRGPADDQTMLVSRLQKDLLIPEEDVNLVAYHNRQEKRVVDNIVKNAE